MEKEIYELLMKNRTKKTFVFDDDLNQLSYYVYGYMACMAERDGKRPKGLWNADFNWFIINKYNKKGILNWVDLIKSESSTNREAWDTFYCLVDEYISERGFS